MTRIGTIKDEYKKNGLWAATKEVPVQGYDLVKENKGKTALVVVGAVLAALTIAYFASPAYADLVNTKAKSAYIGVVEGGKALYAFAAANPAFAILLVVAVVAVVATTIGILAYKNHDKANQIKGVQEEVLNACEKDSDNKPIVKSDKLNFTGDTKSTLDAIYSIVGLTPAAAKSIV